MFSTAILTDQKDDREKEFIRFREPASKILNHEQKIFVTKSIEKKTCDINMFFFSDGSVELKKTNTLYCLEHVPLNTDIILPQKPQFLDYIVLFYEQTTTIVSVSTEKITKIKIRGNGERIMGLDEALICDMAFMSLRLVYGGPIDGWVIC